MADEKTERPCIECKKSTVEMCEHCQQPVCAACYHDHVQIHGDVEDLDHRAEERSDGLVEGTPDELGL